MSSRDNILRRLRAAHTPEMDVPLGERQVMVPMDGKALRDEFIRQVRALSATLVPAADDQEALDAILEVIGEDRAILAWDPADIPLPGLADALQQAGISIAEPRDDSVRVGITGVEAALAATGSLIISAKPGRPRTASLLPYVHIAVLREAQLLPHFEAWIAQQAADTAGFRRIGNHVIITGASRTADIAMELVLGAHGPAQLVVVLLP